MESVYGKSVEGKECLYKKERGHWRKLHTQSFVVFAVCQILG
jgi:hypothetical protein